MWQIFFLFIGFVICFGNRTEVESYVGKDVTFQCSGVSTNVSKIKITWKRSDDTRYFSCNEFCENNTTKHSLGRKDRLISIVTISNVSLTDEDEYSFSMRSNNEREECDIKLTVTVPPTGLIMLGSDELLRDKGSLKVDEGENKTIVCKTNTSVKPAVDLEWLVPEGLNVISEDGAQFQDERDGRLFVSTRILSFTTNYTFDEDRTLVCKVATNLSIEHIQTSIHIINKDGMEPLPLLQKSWAVIAASSSGMILLLAFATAVCIIRKKKMAVRGHGKLDSTRDATQSRLFQSRGSLPPPPSDQPSLTANHLPDRQPSPARSFRPAPPIPPEIPMRQMVPVSDDTNGTTSENNRLRGATSRGASASSPGTHSQRGLDNDMEYDVLNDMDYDVLNMEYAVVDKTPIKATGAVPHVYRETTNGLAEYALVSRPKMGKNALQPRFRSTEQLDAEFEYAVVDKSHRTGRESVPHVYTQTMSGLEEYAVVNKPKDRKKRQSEVRHTTAPGDFEAEYAVVDKWKKN